MGVVTYLISIYVLAVGIRQKTLTPFFLVSAKISSFGGKVVFPWKTSATLPCNAVGDPEPRRHWFKDDETLRIGAGHDYQILESGEIILSNLEKSDTANYTCQVDNPQGSDRIVYNLVVQGNYYC